MARGTDETGYLPVPCDLGRADFMQYLQEHKDDPLVRGDDETVGSNER